MPDQPPTVKRSQRILDEFPPDPVGIPTGPIPVTQPAKPKLTRKQAFHQYLEAQTKLLRAQKLPPMADPATPEGKAARVQLALADMVATAADVKFRDQLLNAFSIVLGVPMDITNNNTGLLPFIRHAVIVPIANSVNHNYPINKPCMLWEAKSAAFFRAILPNGSIGNNLPKALSAIRAATPEEVTAYVDSISSLDAFYGNLGSQFIFPDATDDDSDEETTEEL